MTSDRSTRDSRPAASTRCLLGLRDGFTLTNLVFTMGLGGMLVTVLSSHLTPSRRGGTDVEQVAEVDQGVRGALAMLGREIDRAGACLPGGTPFAPIESADQQDTDSLTVRVGRLAPSGSACVRSVLASRAASGDRQVEVESNAAFRVGDRVLVAGEQDAGEIHTITGMAGSSRIDVEPAVGSDLPSGLSVIALEERHYAIDRRGGRSVLTLQVNGGKPRALVDGLTSLDLTYHLADGTAVSALSGDAERKLVREISLAVTAASRAPDSDGAFVQRADTATVAPRHLL